MYSLKTSCLIMKFHKLSITIFVVFTTMTECRIQTFGAQLIASPVSKRSEITARSGIECVTICTSEDDCKDANFDRKTKICSKDNTVFCGMNVTSYNFAHVMLKGDRNCELPWQHYNTSCYLFVEKTSTWFNAVEYCRSKEQAHLVKIDNACEHQWLVTHLIGGGRDKNYWIGATDTGDEGQWKWVADGSPVTFTKWAPKEPNNYGRNEHCANMKYGHFQWNDHSCYRGAFFICEK